MAHSTTKKKPVAAMIVMGIISIALYATLLLKQDLINEHLRKGRHVRVAADHHGIRIFVLSRRVHRSFLDRSGRRSSTQEKGGKVTCTT